MQEFLAHKTRQQQVLFQRIPWINYTQSAFLLLSMCGATRTNFWLRAVRPEDTEEFARRHDENVWACFREILGTPHASAAAHVFSTSLSAHPQGARRSKNQANRSWGGNKELLGNWRRSSSTIQCGQFSMTAPEPSSVHSVALWRQQH